VDVRFVLLAELHLSLPLSHVKFIVTHLFEHHIRFFICLSIILLDDASHPFYIFLFSLLNIIFLVFEVINFRCIFAGSIEVCFVEDLSCVLDVGVI